jgi:hypothetical protein
MRHILDKLSEEKSSEDKAMMLLFKYKELLEGKRQSQRRFLQYQVWGKELLTGKAWRPHFPAILSAVAPHLHVHTLIQPYLH